MSNPDSVNAVEMRHIHKQFGSLAANDRVSFDLRRAEIHALLGENGAGKTTLMRILYGLYQADQGQILVNSRPVTIKSPKDAIRLGIGMVSQHFALIPPLTVTENIVLGYSGNFRLDIEQAHEKTAAASKKYGIAVQPRALVKNLSVGQRQRVEILKALYRQANVLILDEPTAVLTPQEIEQLFKSLRHLQADGLSVVFISHKLNEVMTITDRVTVLRLGKVVATVDTIATTPAELARLMVGKAEAKAEAEAKAKAKAEAASSPVLLELDNSTSTSASASTVVLELDGVTALDNKGLLAVKNLSLVVRAGEIVGLAGVSGNGQSELAQLLDGTRPCLRGRLRVAGQDMTNAGPAKIMAAGLGRIPEDRHESVVDELTVAQNMALEHLDEFVKNGLLDRQHIRRHAETLITEYQIKAAPHDKIRTLSGGNMQKVILARVIERNPKAIVVAQPTRGLDVGATEYVRSKLLEQRAKGAAILLISEDLDEILELSDRIAVIYEGELMAILPTPEADIKQLGLLMSGVKGDEFKTGGTGFPACS